MVVTRKASSTQPMPPRTSRTNSTTSSPRLRNKKIPGNTPAMGSTEPVLPPVPAVATVERTEPKGREFADPLKVIGSSPLKQSTPGPAPSPIKSIASNGTATSMSGSPKKKGASKRPLRSEKKLTSAFVKGLRSILLLGLIAHTVIVCPHDNNLESPVCRTVHDFSSYFNYYVLEPHVQPRLDDLLSHPSVAKVVQPVVRHTTPIIRQLSPAIRDGSARLNEVYVRYLGATQLELHRHTQSFIDQLQHRYQTDILPVVVPYVAPAVLRLEQWGRIAGVYAEPYLYHGAVVLQDTGRKAKPHALVAWSYLSEVPGVVRQRAWEPLMDIRRTYVDPPLSKILETVDEMGGDAKASTASRFESTFMARAEQIPGDSMFDVQEVDEDLRGASTLEAFISTDPKHTTPLAGMGVGEITPEPHDPTDNEIDDEDLEAFLQELSGGEPDSDASEPETVLEEPQQTETPEQVAERQRLKLQETAEKRADITSRHAEWERKIEALSAAHLAGLPKILEALRANAITTMENGRHAETMEKDANRALKNTDAFIKKLASGPGTTAERVALLEDVVTKVKKRFEDGASVVSGNVMTWWENARQVETEEVEKLVKEVLNLGETGQHDIGLDYAWLDDVTVKDWTRYHDLTNAAQTLQQKLLGMVQGNDQSSPTNALSDAMRHLQVELETVVLRFQNHLSEAHDRGLKAIRGLETTKAETAGEPTFSTLPIEDDLDQIARDDPSQHVILRKDKEQVEDAMRMAQQAEEESAASAKGHGEL